jgi:hypothetical protein
MRAPIPWASFQILNFDMAVILTNLSNQLYETSRQRLNASAAKAGIDQIRSYDFEDLKTTPFYADNRNILDHPTGMGYWLWKPYIILEALKNAADGDIVVYSDAGLEITAPLDALLALCSGQNPVLLFGNGDFVNAAWTKRDCFIYMDCDRPYYWRSPQCDAAFCVFLRCDASLRFVAEWLDYCRDPRIITDDPNTSGRRDLPDFREHRRDQSVLSLLAARHKLPLYRMPTQFGNHYKAPPQRVNGETNCVNQNDRRQIDYYAAIHYYKSTYGQLLDHHRGQSKGAVDGKKAPGLAERISRAIHKRYRRWRNASALKKEHRPIPDTLIPADDKR